jgi:hypothetical protein
MKKYKKFTPLDPIEPTPQSTRVHKLPDVDKDLLTYNYSKIRKIGEKQSKVNKEVSCVINVTGTARNEAVECVGCEES